MYKQYRTINDHKFSVKLHNYNDFND